MMNRREFLGTPLALVALAQEPSATFPSRPRERLAVSTYPFRSIIGSGGSKMSLAQFAQSIPERFNVHGIEPWSRHFESTEPGYVRDLSSSFKKAGLRVVNIPCDVHVQLCSGIEGRTAGLDCITSGSKWRSCLVRRAFASTCRKAKSAMTSVVL
jgi:hypothetical protein